MGGGGKFGGLGECFGVLVGGRGAEGEGGELGAEEGTPEEEARDCGHCAIGEGGGGFCGSCRSESGERGVWGVWRVESRGGVDRSRKILPSGGRP